MSASELHELFAEIALATGGGKRHLYVARADSHRLTLFSTIAMQ